MNISKKVNISLIFTLSFFIFSMLVSTIPCQKASAVPPLNYDWKFCNLNPDSYLNFNENVLFLGYTKSLAETYILISALAFLIPFTVLNIKLRRKNNGKKHKKS